MWKLEDNIICVQLNNGEKYYPSADEIFESICKDNFIKDGESYNSPKKIDGLRFSKIGLNVKTVFEMSEKGIALRVYAIKNDISYPVPVISGNICGYVVIDSVWHYTSKDYVILQDVLSENACVPGKTISYVQYMNIVRDSRLASIEIDDQVIKTVELMKDEVKKGSEEKPHGLVGTLFPYQESGCNWLHFMSQNQCGSILGDEMGLGKTLQVIALLGQLKEEGKHNFLVVAPVSLLVNWQRECAKFYPSLSTVIHHGSKRTGSYEELKKYDVVIMSYSNVQTDMSMLNMIDWDVMVLDEAQNIKNPYANRTISVKKIKRKIGLAVSGTPFENHVSDIWSIVDYVMPGYMGTLQNYLERYEDDNDSAASIEKYLSPIMIRRLVKDVAKDLPERVDIPQPIVMTDKEAMLYENERASVCKEDLKTLTISTMQKLRMFCTHPIVYNKELETIDPYKISNKYARMCELMEEIFSNNEKVIIFTSFNKMFDVILKDVEHRYRIPAMYINGSTDPEKRQAVVDEFSKIVGSAVLVLNPKAAGTGLNITCANHVIHYNLEWNPAIEDQASARAYRRGQKKTVFVYRLYYSDTIEEIINERIQRKRDIFERAVVGNDGDVSDQNDLIRALNISPYGGTVDE